jgi:FMN phosphatase YigB (HAD superfamily)
VRKPDQKIYRLALDHYGVSAEDAFFADDSAENVAGATSVGITGHHLRYVGGVPQVGDLRDAIVRFADRGN